MTAPTASTYDSGSDADAQGETDYDETEEAKPAETPLDRGFLLDGDEKLVRAYVMDLWKWTKRWRDRRYAMECRWERIRAGESGLRVVWSDDNHEYTVRKDFGGRGDRGAANGNNEPDQLLRRLAATINTDPPLLSVGGDSATDEEEEASALAERILRAEGAQSANDDAGFGIEAIDKAGTYATMIAYFETNPQGDGLHPLQIRATKTAKTKDDALYIVDPVSGQQQLATLEQLTWRYVTEKGTLTDIVGEASLVWRCGITRQLIRPSQVSLFPATAKSVYEAEMVMVMLLPTLGQVISQYYKGVRPSEDICTQLTGWTETVQKERLLPGLFKDQTAKQPPEIPQTEGISKVSDLAYVPILRLVARSTPTNPYGANVVIGGPDAPLLREEWRREIGQGDEAHMDPLPMPFASVTWSPDIAGDWAGTAGIEHIAFDANTLATLRQYVLNAAWRAGNPFIQIPIGSSVQPETLLNRDGRAIMTPPGSSWDIEKVPGIDPLIPELEAQLKSTMQSAVGLNDAAANAQTPPDVNSGIQARLLIDESRVAINGLSTSFTKFVIMNGFIFLRLFRAFITQPVQMKYGGPGADTDTEYLVGVELGEPGEITIAKGSGTMLTPTMKTQTAREELDIAMKTGDRLGMERYRRSLLSNTGQVLGLQDDPHRARIDRQVFTFKQLARKTLPEAPTPQFDANGGPIPVPDPAAQQIAAIFPPNPTDVMPEVAQIRYVALSDLLAQNAFSNADPRLQAAAAQEFERMRQAAGVQTVQEIQAAQQAQAQQQMQMEQQKSAAQAQASAQSDQSRVQADAVKAQADAQATVQVEQTKQQGASALSAQDHQQQLQQNLQKAALTPPTPSHSMPQGTHHAKES